MTLEEKAAKIREYCENHKNCDVTCPLFKFLESDCYEGDADIDRNYKELFGDPESDPVNHAAHYNDGGIECIDALEASMTPIEYAGFLKGQVFKYIWRYRLKGKPAEDLKKARYYLDRLIQITERKEVTE